MAKRKCFDPKYYDSKNRRWERGLGVRDVYCWTGDVKWSLIAGEVDEEYANSPLFPPAEYSGTITMSLKDLHEVRHCNTSFWRSTCMTGATMVRTRNIVLNYLG